MARNPHQSRRRRRRAKDRTGLSRSPKASLYFRQGIQFEPLEQRLLLSATTVDDRWHLGLDTAGQQFIQGQALVAIQTPAVWNNGTEVERFLTSQAWPQGLQDIADDFELSYSFRNSSGTNLAVGQFDLSSKQDTLAAIDILNSLSFVEWAQPNYYMAEEPDLVVNDPLLDQQWYLDTISAPQAWDTTTGNANVVIAVLDTGVLTTHDDLQSMTRSNIWTNPLEVPGDNIDNDNNGFVDDVSGWDFVSTANANGDNDPSPVPYKNGNTTNKEQHGTAVAGTAAALMNDAYGVAGVAGGTTAANGVKILPIRVLGKGASSESVARGITYAASFLGQNGPISRLIINMSFGHKTDAGFLSAAPALTTALDMAYNAGSLIVQTAGNGGPDGKGDADPARARLGEWIVVAATDRSDTITGFSNYGAGIDIAAPGLAIQAPSYIVGEPKNWSKPQTFVETHAPISGTSFSAPIVSAVAGLIWSQFPAATRDQVVARLLGTADSIDTVLGNMRVAGGLGNGRVNAARAITDAVSAPTLKEVRWLRDASTNRITRLEIAFQGVLDPATANHLANYQLRGAGPDGVFDTADDTTHTFTIGYDLPGTPAGTRVPVRYRVGSNEVVLQINGGGLAPGGYRLRLNTAGPVGLKNPFGTPVTGNLEAMYTALMEGRTGDVIEVDLKKAFGGTTYTNLTFPDYTLVTDSLGDIHLTQFAAEDAKVVLSTRANDEPFASRGRFYLVPEAAGPVIDSDVTSPGFQGMILGHVTVDGAVRSFQLDVQRGYSTAGQHMVTGGTSLVARLRAEQRLKHFGYPSANGQLLDVDGVYDQRTQEAVRLFNAAVNHQEKNPADATELLFANEYGPGTLNSSAAPRWGKLVPSSGVNFVSVDNATCVALGLTAGCTNPEVWGTSWAAGILLDAGRKRVAASQTPLPFLYASTFVGGETGILATPANTATLRVARAGNVFDGGREMAFDVVTDEFLDQPFYKTRLVAGNPVKVAAAKTGLDSNGDTHVIHQTSGKWYTVAGTTDTLQVDANSAVVDFEVLANLFNPTFPAVVALSPVLTARVIAINPTQKTIQIDKHLEIAQASPQDFSIFYPVLHDAPRSLLNDVFPKVNTSAAELLAMRDFFVDNPDMNGDGNHNDPYVLADVVSQINTLAIASSSSGATISSFYYNDPRTWTSFPGNAFEGTTLDKLPFVYYSAGHFGHFSTFVARPPSSVPIPPSTKDDLMSVLDAAKSVIDGVTASPEFQEPLPALNGKSLQDSVAPANAFQSDVIDPIHNYLQTGAEHTVDGLLGLLDSGLTSDVFDTSFRETGTQLLFDINFTKNVTSADVPLDLGLADSSLAGTIDLSVTADLVGQFNFDFTLGVDLSKLDEPGEAFFLVVNNLSASARVDLYDADISFTLGFLDAGVENGVVLVDATLQATLQDANLDGHLSLSELTDTPLSDLVGVAFTSSIDAELPVHASLGGFSTSTVNPPTIVISDSNLFDGTLPDVTLQNFDQIIDFSSFDADSILAMLRSLATRLTELGQSSVFNFEIPFTDKRLGDAVDLGLDFVDQLETLTGDPSFTGAQSLATQLAMALGVDPAVINPVFDANSRELTYTIDYTKLIDAAVGFQFDASLGPIANVEAAGNLTFGGSVDVDLTFGIDVSPISAKISATADAPASGTFAGEAIFQLQVGGDAPVEVRLFGTGNASIEELVADINVALATAGLAAQVKAERNGNKIQLTTTQITATPTLRITADAANPAVTALRLPASGDAFDNVANHIFIKDQARKRVFWAERTA